MSLLFGTWKRAVSPDDKRNEVGAGYLVGGRRGPPLHFWMLLEGRVGLTRLTASFCPFRHCLVGPPPTRGSLSDGRCLDPTDRDPGEGAAAQMALITLLSPATVFRFSCGRSPLTGRLAMGPP